MITFAARRLRAIILLLVAASIILPVLYAYSISLHDIVYVSGWMLFSLMVFLALYNLRKKLTYPPLLKSSTWLQLHIYIGFFSVLLFLVHVAGRGPSGTFETLMYLLFILLAVSGFVGLYLTRTVPYSLADRGGEVIFERIPIFRRQIGERAERLVVQSIEEFDSTVLPAFFRTRLVDYFSGPGNLWAHVVRSERPRQLLKHELASLYRYLNDGERMIADRLTELIDMKDDLDFHYTRQGLLKFWLFAHIPLTFVLLLFVLVHIVLVYGFAGVSG